MGSNYLRLCALETVLQNKRRHHSEKPKHRNQEQGSPHSPQLGKAHTAMKT